MVRTLIRGLAASVLVGAVTSPATAEKERTERPGSLRMRIEITIDWMPSSGENVTDVQEKTKAHKHKGEAPEVVARALDEALSQLSGGARQTTGTGTAALGPPLTAGEREGFRIAVQQCWNVDVGSPAARITVTVGMEMTREGQVVPDSIMMIAASEGPERAVEAAFGAARRAILRCQRDNGGFDLPAEKYRRWREIEITFDPDKMRTR